MPYNPALYMPQGYQPVYQQPMSQMQQIPQPQMMSPPTIRAEIVQVEGEQAAAAYPVGAGASQTTAPSSSKRPRRTDSRWTCTSAASGLRRTLRLTLGSM